MNSTQFSEFFQKLTTTKGKITPKKYARVYTQCVKKAEREGLRVIKDAFNMFVKAERKLVKKTVTRKPRASTKKQQAQIQELVERERRDTMFQRHCERIIYQDQLPELLEQETRQIWCDQYVRCAWQITQHPYVVSCPDHMLGVAIEIIPEPETQNECCVCMEVQQTCEHTERLCPAHHYVCVTCLDKLLDCPICRQPYAGKSQQEVNRERYEQYLVDNFGFMSQEVAHSRVIARENRERRNIENMLIEAGDTNLFAQRIARAGVRVSGQHHECCFRGRTFADATSHFMHCAQYFTQPEHPAIQIALNIIRANQTIHRRYRLANQ